MRLLEPGRYQDSQAKRRCERESGRVCFGCGQLEGYYNVRDFRYGKEVCFSCFGCPEPRRVQEEAVYGAAGLGGRVLDGVAQADRAGKRWCKGCWGVVTMYVNARLV